MKVIIYNCKRCKTGKRAEYPIKTTWGYTRIDSSGVARPAGVWIQSCGGGRPTVYGGDAEFGICPGCNRMMTFGELQARLNTRHKCDARCLNARGPLCECSCGGANHGAGFADSLTMDLFGDESAEVAA